MKTAKMAPKSNLGAVMTRPFSANLSLPDRRKGERVRRIRGYEAELIENWFEGARAEGLAGLGDSTKIYVLDYRGVLVSTCSLLIRRDGVSWLGGLLVPRHYRGRGFGLSMLSGLLDILEDGRCELAAALVTTESARSAFIATGFMEAKVNGLPLVANGMAPYLETREPSVSKMRYEKGKS
jgi:GNAT superfamily N-acetyltransferase